MAFQKYSGLTAERARRSATADALHCRARPSARRPPPTPARSSRSTSRSSCCSSSIDGRTEWIFNTSTGNGKPYDEEDQNTPGEVAEGVAITRTGCTTSTGSARGLVGGRPRQDLPAEVLRRRRRRPRLEQRAQLSRLARLRAGQRAGDGLHLGDEPDADGHPGLGPRRRSDPAWPSSLRRRAHASGRSAAVRHARSRGRTASRAACT